MSRFKGDSKNWEKLTKSGRAQFFRSAILDQHPGGPSLESKLKAAVSSRLSPDAPIVDCVAHLKEVWAKEEARLRVERAKKCSVQKELQQLENSVRE